MPEVLTVSHFFHERAEFTGYEMHRRVVGDDIPFKVVGYNPELPDSGPATSWNELRRRYQGYGVYLNTTRSGASMAMFEAAAAGMPLVTTPRLVGANEFTDGYDAFVSAEPERLRACVLRLMNDKVLARKMGERGRRTVARIWGIKPFLADWQEALHAAVLSPGPQSPTLSMPVVADFFRCDFRVEQAPKVLHPDEIAWLRVHVSNAGSGTWLAYTKEHVGEVLLVCGWSDQNGDTVDVPLGHAPLPRDLQPGEAASITAMVRSPASPGPYLLRLELICLHVGRFSRRGGTTADIWVTIE